MAKAKREAVVFDPLKEMTDEQLRKALRDMKDTQAKAAAQAREIVLEMQRRIPLTSSVPGSATQPQSAKQAAT